MQRVNFTLVDMTQKSNLVEIFGHLNPYYLNFLKAQIFKTELASFKTSEKFSTLMKESPIVVVDDMGDDSLRLVNELEAAGFLNVFYVLGGAQNLIDTSKN